MILFLCLNNKAGGNSVNTAKNKMTTSINHFGQIQNQYQIGDTYASQLVVMNWCDNSFIVTSKNGWYTLMISNKYESFWAVKTSRKINECISHRNNLISKNLLHK